MNNIRRAQERQKCYYDAKHDSNHVSDVNNILLCKHNFVYFINIKCSDLFIIVGSKVVLKNKRHSHRMGGKLDIKWNGPYIVKARLTKGRYQLQSSNGVVLKKLYSTCLLKEYFEAGIADMS